VFTAMKQSLLYQSEFS